MKTICVDASKKYDVLVGSGLLRSLGEYAASTILPGKAAIISDTNVWPLYGPMAEASLRDAGFDTVTYLFPAGEASKNTETYVHVLNFLAENRLTRADCIIALGGGVVGDLAGFAAATYLRGIAYIQVPTTLLAMVDSSIGGKTAVDLPAGKNLAGAFYQPSIVICDTNALHTLPEDILRDGCAEVIKYAVLYDAQLFSHLLNNGMAFDKEAVISRCVELKRDVIMLDEFDTGARMMLNFGHTIGHGIEAQSHYCVSHGKAVAIGMAIVSKAANSYKLCTDEAYVCIMQLLNVFQLPSCTSFSAQQIYTGALSDKKRTGSNVNLIIPRQIGKCEIYPTPLDQLLPFIEAGL